MTIEQTIKEVETMTSRMTDTYIRHYESEIKYTQEKAKLSLWIIGLSVGVELFLMNKLDRSDLEGWLGMTFFCVINSVFLINAFLGLLIRLKQTRLISHFLTVQTLYDYQKNQILMNLNPESTLFKRIVNDFNTGKAPDNLMNIEYLNESETKNDKVSASDRVFLQKSDNVPSLFLVVQVITTIAYFIYLLY